MDEHEAEKFIKGQEEGSDESQKKEKSLGHITPKHEREKAEVKDLAAELGYKPVPLESLPTRGLFYPEGTKIVIKAATNAEIRHWSSIDERDESGVDDIINLVVSACVKINMPGKVSSPKDLKELDRFYLLFAIREITFSDGQNKLYADIPGSDKVELRKELIKYFEFPEELEPFYNNEKRCFTFVNPQNKSESFDFFIPSIGVTKFTKDLKINAERARKGNIDDDFLKFFPFVVSDWRGLNEDRFKKVQAESYSWSLWRISMLSYATDIISKKIDPQIVIPKDSGVEDTYPLSFHGGLRAIFLIPDPLGRPR